MSVAELAGWLQTRTGRPSCLQRHSPPLGCVRSGDKICVGVIRITCISDCVSCAPILTFNFARVSYEFVLSQEFTSSSGCECECVRHCHFETYIWAFIVPHSSSMCVCMYLPVRSTRAPIYARVSAASVSFQF